MYWAVVVLIGISLSVTDSSVEFQTEVKGIVPEKCLQCICKVESQCKAIGCRMDVGSLSCGYFQIKLPYWIDCYKPKPSSGCSGDTDCWKKCADDMTCASKCVNAYMSRYVHQPGCKANCESFARLHNGGPSGCTNPGTDGYWKKVKACLGDSKSVDWKLVFAEILAFKSN